MASVKTPIGILSFPTFFTPRPRAQGGDPVFSCNLLFDKAAQQHPAFADLRRAVGEAIDEKWGTGKSKDRSFLAGLRSPFRKCSEKDYKGYDIEGGVYIAPWSNNRPGIVDARTVEITVPQDVWAGQLARVTVNAFAYQNSGNKGVSFGLNNVQICRTDGERLDGRIEARKEFDPVDDGGAPPGGIDDDEIPF